VNKEVALALFFLVLVAAGFVSITLSLTRGFVNSINVAEMRYFDGEDYGK